MQSIIVHNSYIAKDFVTRFTILLGEKVQQQEIEVEWTDKVRQIVDRVEGAFTELKQENYHLKNKL